MAQMVRNLPAMQETWVPSLGWEDPSLQYSCLVNSMDEGAWWAIVHGVTERQTRLSDWYSLLLEMRLGKFSLRRGDHQEGGSWMRVCGRAVQAAGAVNAKGQRVWRVWGQGQGNVKVKWVGLDRGHGKECGFYPECQWEAMGEFEAGQW